MVLELIRFSFEECEINLQVLVDAKAFVLSLKFNPKWLYEIVFAMIEFYAALRLPNP